jgi:hypothetical protein
MLSNRGIQEAIMAHQQDIFADPFLKESDGKGSVPSDAILICSYDSDFGLDSLEETAYIIRGRETDELWIESSYKTGCAYIVPCDGSIESASVRLLDRLFRAQVGFYWPTELISPGIIKKRSFNTLVRRIKRELEENRKKARKAKTEIVEVAEELGLNPRPTGEAPNLWASNCPGTNHFLYISSTTNTFGCGWCKRKGGVEELRGFVEERKAK